MRTHMSELIDLALTQAIERYMEMEPEAAYDAISLEWPEQTAVLLEEFFFGGNCSHCSGRLDFIQMQRVHNDSNFVVPFCACDQDEDGFHGLQN